MLPVNLASKKPLSDSIRENNWTKILALYFLYFITFAKLFPKKRFLVQLFSRMESDNDFLDA